MIDPHNITDYYRSHYSLLEFWLFCLFVRGKTAKIQAEKLDDFVQGMGGIEYLPDLTDSSIEYGLRAVKAGQYKSLMKAIVSTLEKVAENRLFLVSASVEELEAIPGVGPKTARFFVLHSRKDARAAVLDTHLVKFLSRLSGQDFGKGTPASAGKYAKLETMFLCLADSLDVTPAELDLAVWRAYNYGNPSTWRKFLSHKKGETR